MKDSIYTSPHLRTIAFSADKLCAISFNGDVSNYQNEPGLTENIEQSGNDLDFGW